MLLFVLKVYYQTLILVSKPLIRGHSHHLGTPINSNKIGEERVQLWHCLKSRTVSHLPVTLASYITARIAT